MDLRQHYRAYTTIMRCFRDDPSLLTIVRWYTTDRRAKFLGVPTAFASRRWERELPQLPIGELQDAFEHARDYAPPGVTGAGHCGTDTQWAIGCLTSDPLPALNPANGLPVCCGSAVQLGLGGEAEGGDQTVPIPGCPGPAPAVLYCGLSLFGTPMVFFGTGTFIWSGLGYWLCVTDWIFPGGANLRGSRLFPRPSLFQPWRMLFSTSLIPQFFLLANCGPTWSAFVDNGFPGPGDTVFTFSSDRFFAAFERGTGGEAEGGRGWILLPPVQRSTGGEAEGGEGTSNRAHLGDGGEAEGGEGTSARNFSGDGGEAEGGEGLLLPVQLGEGGEAEGGGGVAIPAQIADGGEAEGGDGTP